MSPRETTPMSARTFTRTVTRSPICCARWSLKKAREPCRHREFDANATGCGLGIGMRTGL